MLQIALDFEEFQLVSNFLLYFTFPLLSSIRKRSSLAQTLNTGTSTY